MATDLIANGPGIGSGLAGALQRRMNRFLLQSAADGAWSPLFAATSPDARPSIYYGPDRMLGLNGSPTVARMSSRARNAVDARRLWDVSEQLTGAKFA